MATDKKYLFAIDLDGTLLSNSATSEIHPDTVKSIKKLREQAMQGNLDSARKLRTLQIKNRK